MERRQFLEVTGLSLCGYLVLPGIMGFSEHQSHTLKWLKKWQELTDARLLWPAPEGLNDAISQHLQLPEYRNYTFKYGSWRLFGQGQYAFCAIELDHPTAGMLDLSVPVFEKKEAGNWQLVTVLSAFHLEAIAQVAEQGKISDKPISAFLLPIGGYAAGQRMGSFYHTAEGVFGVAPQVSSQGIEITSIIYDKKGIVVKEWRQTSANMLV